MLVHAEKPVHSNEYEDEEEQQERQYQRRPGREHRRAGRQVVYCPYLCEVWNRGFASRRVSERG